MFFYFIFGASLLTLPSVRLPALVLTFFLLITIGQQMVTQNPLLITYTDKILLEFLAGVIIGALYIRGITLNTALAYAAIVASIIIFVGFETTILPGKARVVMWGIPAILLIVGTLSLESVSNIRHLYSLQMIGDASYSIYLSHILTIEMVELFWMLLGWKTDTLVTQMMFVAYCIGVSAFVGIAIFYMIEQPLLRILRPLWRQTNITTV
jgi:exopolysaccharide production protein ExoZ